MTKRAKSLQATEAAKSIVSSATKSAHNLSWCDELSQWGKDLLRELVICAAAKNPTPQVSYLARELIKATGISRSVTTVSRKLKEMIDEEKNKRI